MTQKDLDSTDNDKAPLNSTEQSEETSDVSEFDEVIPTEILEEIPEKHRAEVRSSLSIMMGAARERSSSPLARKVTSEHVGKMIDNSDKEDKRDFIMGLVGEATKMFSVIGILTLVSIVLFYAAKTKDRELSEKVFIGAVSAVGGVGVGYGIGQAKKE